MPNIYIFILFHILFNLQQQVRENAADIAKIQEVTGINDYRRINEAIKQCRNEKGAYELDEVITVLLSEAEPAPSSRVCQFYWRNTLI